MNELTHTLWTKYTCSVVNACGQQNGTRQHYATLSACTVSYGKHTQTRTFKNYANLLTWQVTGLHSDVKVLEGSLLPLEIG